MEIENLSKSQIILLTLLVSFVTSIATGIVTVSLMQQAPPAIAQTVNRIVEHTVEKVVSTGQAAAVAVPVEKTVIVKESELIGNAIKTINPSVVRMYSSDAQSPIFLGLGIVIDKSGKLLTDISALGDYADASVELSDGTRVRAVVVNRNNDLDIAYLNAATTTSDGKPVIWSPASFSVTDASLGETIVMVSGKSATRVEDGIVTSFIPDTDTVIVDTNVLQDHIMFGSPFIDTDGNVLGVSTGHSRASSASGFIPASLLMPKAKVDANVKK